MDYEKELNKIHDTSLESINILIQLVFVKVVKPFCDKYKVRLSSGMGGYTFITRRGTHLLDSTVGKFGMHVKYPFRRTKAGKELEEILKVLNLEAFRDGFTLGSQINEDYPAN